MIGSTLRLSTLNCRCFVRRARNYISGNYFQVTRPTFDDLCNSLTLSRNACAFHTSALRSQENGHSKASKGQVEESVESAEDGKPLTQRQKLKKIFAEYGTTAIVFHISISLTSLGICYAAVKSGVDVQAALQKIGLNNSITDSSVATQASTFVVAYACHKVFAPVRMFMTITCTPLIVRKLRKVGILKQPLKQ